MSCVHARLSLLLLLLSLGYFPCITPQCQSTKTAVLLAWCRGVLFWDLEQLDVQSPKPQSYC